MASLPKTRAELARHIDATLLSPDATEDDVLALCREAAELGAFAVCVSPSRLPLPSHVLGGRVAVATVCGFPSGAHSPAVKAAEARAAVHAGAHEVDMVLDLGAVRSENWELVRAEISAVRAAVPAPTVLKVICESALWDDETLRMLCRLSVNAGADFVKTSTGFSPAGGATEHAVRVMAAEVGGLAGIKASGGIRTTEAALAMLEAGATRLGLSAVAPVLNGLRPG